MTKHMQSGVSRRTIFAYGAAGLATLATPGVGYLAALQACAMPDTRGIGRALAVQMATEAAIPGGCQGEAGVGLYMRARMAEERYFGARAAAEVPAGFPLALAVLPRSRAAVSDAR